MNIQALEKMLSIIPDGPKKQAYLRKVEEMKKSKNNKRKGGSGLQDTFEFKPKGHIKIESIDNDGNVVGTLADKPNLVVDGAEEILLRSFSGDPNRVLYKNRKAKVSPTNAIFIEESVLAGENLFDGSQLLHAPNILWSAVNDEDFEVTYGYYPVTVYVKEVESTEFGKKAFVISNEAAAGYIPMNAEIYSTYSNLFIGIGEGTNYKLDLNSPILTYSEGFAPTAEEAKTTTEGHFVTFKQKISNFSLDLEVSNKGAQVDVFINGALKETIETLDSDISVGEVRTFEYKGIDNEVETEVKIVHSGADSGENPEMTIKGIYIDALNKNMNGLMKEFTSYETNFLTPAVYNTTPMAPFTIQLPHFPVKANSVNISYNELAFTQVDQEAELTDTTFQVDLERGIVTFNRALTGLMATFSTTGEIYDSELSKTMTSVSVAYVEEEEVEVSDETASGAVNGSNKSFTVSKKNLKDGTVSVKVAGTKLESNAISSINLATGQVILTNAPTNGQTVQVSYTYVKSTNINHSALKYNTKFAIKDGSLKVLDQSGKLMPVVAKKEDFGNGKVLVADEKTIHIAAADESGEVVTKVEVIYSSDEQPGVPTGYTRAVIEKPKSVNEYPWFELDKGSVRFVAEFPESIPTHNITIREMGLFDGPRTEDGVAGFRKYPVKAFSLVRVGETRKDTATGIRITWTITLLNEEGQPFQGGLN